MLSTKCKYAIRALIYLSIHSDSSNKINIVTIGDALKIPVPYLRKILQDLVPKGIVYSTKGPNGGFYLDSKNRNIPLLRLVEVIDGLTFFETCGLGLNHCSENNPCPFHEDFAAIKARFKKLLTEKTLQDLADDIRSTNALLVN